MSEGDTFRNGLLGGMLTILFALFLPLAPVLGGGLAGYLEGGRRSDGVAAGLVAGGVSLIPVVLLGFVVGNWFAFAAATERGLPPAFVDLSPIFLAIVIGMLVTYMVGLSVLGGYIGNYVRIDTDYEF